MSFDLAKILQSKREYRQRLSARPIEEKLAMLDALRARSLALRGSRAESQPGMLRSRFNVPSRADRTAPDNSSTRDH